MNTTFFICEIIFSFYLLLNLALIAEKFLMPSLMNISRRYKMSKDMTGIIVAMGNLVPELTTTVISFMKHGVKMTEFGVASNIGTGVFVITVVPAVAILMTYKNEHKDADPSKPKSQEQMDMEHQMMLTIYRDLGFFIAGLIIYDIILYKGLVYI